MAQVIRSPKTYDVIVVGSGAGGGMAAKILTEGGLNVAMLEAGPLHMALTIDGRPLPIQTIDRTDFNLSLVLPNDLVGRPKIEVAFTVDRTTKESPDGRDLGLAFGEFNIR